MIVFRASEPSHIHGYPPNTSTPTGIDVQRIQVINETAQKPQEHRMLPLSVHEFPPTSRWVEDQGSLSSHLSSKAEPRVRILFSSYMQR